LRSKSLRTLRPTLRNKAPRSLMEVGT
jgi:hypothetical protein